MKSNLSTLSTKLGVLVVVFSATASGILGGVKINNAPEFGGRGAEIRRIYQTPTLIKTNNSFEFQTKTEDKIRIGLGGVKTGAVGEGVNAAELAGAIQNTLNEYLKGTNVEIVPLEAKLASSLEAEAKEKACSFVLYAQVSHKKGGGGGFGKMFGQMAPMLSTVIPGAGMMGGVIGGAVASTVISTAAGASQNVKAKDEITLDIKMQNGATVALTKQFKAKAKQGGEDLISPLVEQAATAILAAIGTK